MIPSHLSKFPLGPGCQHSSGQQVKLYPGAWTRRLMGPVPSYLLHPSAKPFLLIALALAFPRQLPRRAHDQHLHQLYTLPLFSDLLGCVLLPAPLTHPCGTEPYMKYLNFPNKVHRIHSRCTQYFLPVPFTEREANTAGIRHSCLKQISFSFSFLEQQPI